MREMAKRPTIGQMSGPTNRLKRWAWANFILFFLFFIFYSSSSSLGDKPHVVELPKRRVVYNREGLKCLTSGSA